MRKALSVSAVALALMASACGQQVGITLDELRASRLVDGRVEVEADVTVAVLGGAEQVQEVQEVCAEATWIAEGGQTLSTAKTCTTEAWKDGESKVLKLISAEPIPTTAPATKIAVKLTATATEGAGLRISDQTESELTSP
ncbi:MAG: hypothetical protein WBV82_26250 [Myxococcaceae bacterium]